MNLQVNNTAEIRSLNIKKIINCLRYSEPMTKKNISNILGLSFATISNLCNDLLSENILKQTPSLISGGGRIPGLVSINPFSKYYISVNLMKKNVVQIALSNFRSEVVDLKYCKIAENESLDELLIKMNTIILELLNSRNIANKDVIGVGVSVSGAYHKIEHCLINANNIIYTNQPLELKMNSFFKMTVCVDNDTNLLVLATSEYYQKDTRNSDIVYLFIGEGFGTGIISEGRIIAGRNGIGGETNHMPLGNKNYKCHCGNYGCVETEVSLKGFLRIYQEAAGLDLSFTFDDWDDFVEQVLNGNEIALEVVKNGGIVIGKLISSLVNIFGTENFYIGGITEKIFDYLYPDIVNAVKNRVFIKELANVNIYNSISYEKLIFRGCNEIAFAKWMP